MHVFDTTVLSYLLSFIMCAQGNKVVMMKMILNARSSIWLQSVFPGYYSKITTMHKRHRYYKVSMIDEESSEESIMITEHFKLKGTYKDLGVQLPA